MTIVQAHSAIDLRNVDFHSVLAGNVWMVSPPQIQETTFQDFWSVSSYLGLHNIWSTSNPATDGLYTIGWAEGPDEILDPVHLDLFLGTGMEIDENGVISAGTVTSLLRIDQLYYAEFALIDIAIDSAALSAAMSTTSTADDYALLAAQLTGDDEVRLSDFDDYFSGFGGNDTIDAEDGDDTILGGAGRDELDGGYGNDTLDGGRGRDILEGWDGDDHLFGGAGNDRLEGWLGNDVLVGSTGRDVMSGDFNNDIFVFNTIRDSAAKPKRADVITDFRQGEDQIDLSAIADTHGDLTFAGRHRLTAGDDNQIVFQIIDRRGWRHDITLVRIDVDGDARPESVIRLNGIHHLTADDFIL